MKKTDLERFYEKFDVDPETGCWIWKTSACHKYGSFWFQQRVDRAHRASYKLFVGDIPDGSNVLHRCDNPKCVNSDHLFLGTQQDNMTDKCNKGRQPSGEQHASWKGGKRASRADYHRNRYHELKHKLGKTK